MTEELEYRVFTVTRPGLGRDIPHGYESLMWVANSATLIYGERDAVLVDTFLTIDHGAELADQVAATGKNLTHIYITHAHGDHFFGINALKQRFPEGRAVATPSVVDRMAGQFEPDVMDGIFRRLFPGQIPDDPGTAKRMDGASIDLEGHPLIPIETGNTDTADSTSLHVPSIGLIVAGDVVYSGIHPYLAETNAHTRPEWIAALDKLEALEPRAVVAGHKIPHYDDDPRHIAETRQYLRDFNRLDRATDTPRALFNAMIELYPDRANPGSLWGGANAAKSEAGNGSARAVTTAAQNEQSRDPLPRRARSGQIAALAYGSLRDPAAGSVDLVLRHPRKTPFSPSSSMIWVRLPQGFGLVCGVTLRLLGRVERGRVLAW